MIPNNNTGIPIDYDSDTYTVKNQLKELQILKIHESDLFDDTSPSSPNDEGFESDHSQSNSYTPNLFDLADPAMRPKSNKQKHKYDRMEPLIFAVHTSHTNNIKLERERRDSDTPNTSTHCSSSPITPKHQKIPHKIDITHIKLPHNSSQITQTTQPITTTIPERKTKNKNKLHIRHSTDKINNLLNDIWWLLDSDKELKYYKKTDTLYRNDMLVLFKTFNLMENNGDKICYTFYKLLGPQIIDFSVSQSIKYMNMEDYNGAIKAYNIIIRICAILSDTKNLHLYYLKRSECYFKNYDYFEALQDAKKSYKINAKFESGYVFHGKILMAAHKYQSAYNVYVLGYALDGKLKKSFAVNMQIALKQLKLVTASHQIDILHLDIDDNEMEDEEQRSYLTLSQEIQKEIKIECNIWKDIVVGIRCSDEIYLSAMKQCEDIEQCECLKRVVFLQRVYIKWLEKFVNYMSLNEWVEMLCGKMYFYKDLFLLYNDYIHIKDQHENWQYFSRQFGICENESCDIFGRHFGDKSMALCDRKKKYFGFIHSKNVVLIQLFDEIHCHFTHCNPLHRDTLYTSICDIDHDNDDNSDADNDEKQSFLKCDNLNANMCAHNKFTSHLDNKLGEMEFVQQFVYWEYFKHSRNYCIATYKTLKSELLCNDIYAINKYVFGDLLIKCKWVKHSYLCVLNMNAKDKGLENVKLNVSVGLKISLSHIMVLLLMSDNNYIFARHNFVKQWKLNSEIANLCKLLYECVLFYGEEMKNDEYFYGICDIKLLFNNYHLSFKRAISFSSSLSHLKRVINKDKNNESIIIKYGLSDSYGCPYFNVSKMFSNNSFECEYIFFNCKLQIYDILYKESDAIISNYKYIQSLIFFEKLVRGYFVCCDYEAKARQLYEEIVTQMIDNFIHPKRQSVLPIYIEDLFGFYCDSMDEIWLIRSQLSSLLCDKLREYFIDSNDILIDSSNPDSYGAFLRMIETNHKMCDTKMINFVNEYVWYIDKNTFNNFISLHCDQYIVGPKVHVQIAYEYNSYITNNDCIIFEPNCYKSLKFAPGFGAFGLTILQLPKYVEKIKFEYQVFCKEANYILLVPAGKKWFKKGDNVAFKSFKSETEKEFSYRFTIKIIEIHKKNL